MGYNSLLRKIILIIGDIICLYLATSIAMVLELGNKQTDKIAFHLEFLPILVIMMFFMFNVYGLFSLIRKKAGRYFSEFIGSGDQYLHHSDGHDLLFSSI